MDSLTNGQTVQSDKWTDCSIHRQTNVQTHKWTDRQMCRQTNGQTDKETDRWYLGQKIDTDEPWA